MMRLLLLLILLCVTPETKAQWIETREIFAGTPLVRTADIPYYYPYFESPDFGHGFYYDYARLPAEYRTPAYQRLCMRQMAGIGMTTFTAYGWLGNDNLDDLNLQLTLAMEEGLAKRPVMILPCGDPRIFIPKLKIPEGFPDIVGYGPDEPADTPEAARQVEESVSQWHDAGMRVATAISADHAKVVGEPLDIWIVHVPDLGEIVPDGKHEIWMYDCQQRGTNQDLHRYEAGLYSYAAHRKIGAKAMFWWAYVNDANSGVFINEDGSIK